MARIDLIELENKSWHVFFKEALFTQ